VFSQTGQYNFFAILFTSSSVGSDPCADAMEKPANNVASKTNNIAYCVLRTLFSIVLAFIQKISSRQSLVSIRSSQKTLVATRPSISNLNSLILQSSNY